MAAAAIVGSVDQARKLFEDEEAEREAERDAKVIDVPAKRSDKPRKAKRRFRT